ncbi:MAG TPA: GxxExxY protein [Candidatus Uhrbacteria bacterium]|nr:GxxExxY protein [Candidatus Uhrbacteria bacterium]
MGEGKVIYKELSYIVVGILFTVYNDLGYGYKEKYYENAIERELHLEKLNFKKQVPYNLVYKGKVIGRLFIDFIIDDKIVLEIKKGNYFNKRNIEQVKEYLKISGKRLAILANFTPTGVKFLRVFNPTFNQQIYKSIHK